MADSAVSFIVGRLAEFVVKEAGVLKEVGSDVVLLKDKLQWLHTFVQQADQRRRRGGNAYMDVWVQQTREVALEVEDVLDEFMLRVDLHQGLPRWRKWLKLLSGCATQISLRHQLSGRITIIKARLEQISNHRNAYITDYATSSATRPSPSISTTEGWDEEVEVVGSDKDRISLEDQLLGGDKSRLIVSIVGESGVGKSTLAWRVYDSPVVKGHFKARAWLNLPPCITEADIVHLICKRLCPGGGAASTMERIHDSLSEHLNARSYLIVVDGIVKVFNWSSVLDALPNNGLGSRVVIINSLNDNGAALAGLSAHWLRVHHLLQEDSKLMFVRNACGRSRENQHRSKYFGSKELSESEYNEAMDKACKDVFEVTNGLPLAILLLGRLLRRKEFPDQWTYVLEHLKSMERSSRLEGILALSFDDLPHYLKPCFLHFAMMPENLIHNARRLVRLWVAEGFLKPRKGESMEDVGHRYLKELVSRGMVRLIKKASEEEICWLVTVHQRLHAMARFETQEATFLDVYDMAHLASSTAVRHLFLQNFRDAYIHQMMDASFTKLRSFICAFADEWESSKPNEQRPRPRAGGGGGASSNNDQSSHNSHHLSLPRRSRLLRVIDLRGLQVAKVPPEIGSFIHLRYLAIRSSCLVELPPTIANLINLQTLDIKGCSVEKVTRAFWTIPTLRHILADKLRLPKSVGEIKDMQGLVGVVCVHPWHNNMSPLHNMVNLRHLQISKLNPDHWDALSEAFKKLESLLYLNLGGRDIPFTLFTRFSLRRLQILELFGRIVMTGETEERCTLPNLTRLELKYSMVNQGFINKIGKLPCLTELVLSNRSYVAGGLVFSASEFANLTKLVLRGLSRVSEWKIGSESLPRVEKITVSDCIKMKLKIIGGEQEVLRNIRELVTIDMPDSWPGVEESTALGERLKRVIVTHGNGQRAQRGKAARR